MSETNIAAGIGVALGFLLGIVGHEAATHFAAVAAGDRTPRLHGRLTLSLKAHADPLGTYILPGVFVAMAIFSGFVLPPFGWGKRHAINLRMTRNQNRNAVLVPLAGPAVTALLAVALWGLARSGTGKAFEVVGWIAFVNVGLTVFELIPIPGRDGGRILARFLSPQAALKMEELAEYEVLFLLVLFLFVPPLANGIFLAGCRTLTSGAC